MSPSVDIKSYNSQEVSRLKNDSKKHIVKAKLIGLSATSCFVAGSFIEDRKPNSNLGQNLMFTAAILGGLTATEIHKSEHAKQQAENLSELNESGVYFAPPLSSYDEDSIVS